MSVLGQPNQQSPPPPKAAAAAAQGKTHGILGSIVRAGSKLNRSSGASRLHLLLQTLHGFGVNVKNGHLVARRQLGLQVLGHLVALEDAPKKKTLAPQHSNPCLTTHHLTESNKTIVIQSSRCRRKAPPLHRTGKQTRRNDSHGWTVVRSLLSTA